MQTTSREKSTPRVKKGRAIFVEHEAFAADPLTWCLKATASRSVVVRKAGVVAMVIGVGLSSSDL